MQNISFSLIVLHDIMTWVSLAIRSVQEQDRAEGS